MIGQIENAMLDRLKAAQTALGYAFGDLDSLPVDIEDKFKESIIRFPAAWVTFSGFRTITTFSTSAKVRGRFHLVLAAQNLRNERSARQGGTSSEVGSYQLACDAAALFIGADLGLEISPLEMGELTPLYTGIPDKKRSLSLMALELFTEFSLDQAEFPSGELGDFVTFHANWDIPPHGGIDADTEADGVQLPDDANADTSTTVTLETQP
ncbi:MAG: phage protein Gp37 [Caulobacteraceae bacterium]